jgi:hypothetical protein
LCRRKISAELDADGVDEKDQPEGRYDRRQRDARSDRAHRETSEQNAGHPQSKPENPDLAQQVTDSDHTE